MAVTTTDFDGSSFIVVNAGAFSPTGAISLAVLCSLDDISSSGLIDGMAGGSKQWGMAINSGGNLILNIGVSDDNSSTVAPPSGEWVFLAVTRAVGAPDQNARAHMYLYSTGAWSHVSSGAYVGNPSAIDSMEIGGHDAGFRTDGRFAVAAAWLRDITDAEIETMASGVAGILASNPTAFWKMYNAQAPPGPLFDASAAGASTESSRTGTTASFDYPTGFVFGTTSSMLPRAMVVR